MFKKEFWKSSMEKMRSTRWLAVMAVFLCLRIVVSRFSIPVSANLNISLSFILVALEGVLFGPTAGIVFAFTEDILEFLLFPSPYGFFFGYTISAMLGVLTYALFLYNQRITVIKIIGAKLISSYAINVLLGSFWTYLLVGSSFYKNTILFPIQIIGILLVINLMLPFFTKKKYVTTGQKAPIPFF